jgi:4-hydroxy-L-threonine phosphate dehydrogenase PdxA
MSLPLLAITQGDPTGIGPEIIIGAWCDPRLHASARCAVIGHPEILRRATRLVSSTAEVVEIDDPGAAKPSRDVIPCLRVDCDDILEATPGQIDARGGQAAYEALLRAVELAQLGQIDAIVTAPLNKAALWAAGHRYPGHTEILAELCGVKDFAMMLYLGPAAFMGPANPLWEANPLANQTGHAVGERIRLPQSHRTTGLGVVHVTLHTALRDVFAQLSPDAIVAKTRLIQGVMQRLGVREPRIAVCALNPHAGEDGLFGDEEQTTIAPAVERARRDGLNVSGPLPADTLMVRARDGEFDAVVAMYHDQGHIALKLIGMRHAVNITLGLPIIRTSVAHGTAFDIAWQGWADHSSLIEAVAVAAQLANTKKVKMKNAK